MTNEILDAFIKEQLDRIRKGYEDGHALDFPEALLLCRKNKKEQKTYTEEAPSHMVMVMPDSDDEAVRSTLKEAAWDNDGFLVLVKLEAWFTLLPEGMDPKLKAMVQEASQNHTMHLLEPPLRKEKVRLYIESEIRPIQCFEAEIHRDGDKATLDPWEEMTLRLPRPEFKRYLPDVRDGKRTFVMPGFSIQTSR